MAELRMEGLAHSYSANPKSEADYALKRLEFVWADGGAYALLGPSGCGKTTMLNILSGLLTPSEGKVVFDGRDVTDERPRNRNIAQVFQFPVIYDTMTVRQNLAFPLKNRGLDTATMAKRVGEVADMLELNDLLGRRASGLSADQKQIISLARGLVRDDVAAILFDEPLTVIDPHMKWLLRRQLKRVHERFRHTLIYVTHDQNEALTFAEQVVVMHDGHVVQIGTPQALFEQPEHTFVGHFIGSPGMNLLPAERDADGLRLGRSDVVLKGPVAAGANAANGSLQIGIRPEFVEVHSSAGDERFAVAVDVVEDLGNYQLVRARLGEQEIVAKVPENVEIGTDSAFFRFPHNRTHLYADGRRVAAGGVQ